MPRSRPHTGRSDRDGLGQLPLFADFDASELALLEPFGERLTRRAGELIIEEKKPQPYLYVILEGSCEVFRTEGGKRQHIVSMDSGEMLGEMAVLNPPHATAGVVAISDVELWRLSRAEFRRFLDASPVGGAKLMKLMARTFAERL